VFGLFGRPSDKRLLGADGRLAACGDGKRTEAG
jgi:hypothetical protein